MSQTDFPSFLLPTMMLRDEGGRDGEVSVDQWVRHVRERRTRRRDGRTPGPESVARTRSALEIDQLEEKDVRHGEALARPRMKERSSQRWLPPGGVEESRRTSVANVDRHVDALVDEEVSFLVEACSERVGHQLEVLEFGLGIDVRHAERESVPVSNAVRSK